MHKTKYFIFSFLSYGTSIHDNNICLYRVDNFFESCRIENHMNFLTICIIHLTTECFNEVCFYLHKVFYIKVVPTLSAKVIFASFA